MSFRTLHDKRILWGSIFMVCITLGLLMVQPVSVMLAESPRQVVQAPTPPAISLKRLQSSSALSTPGAAEVPYTNNVLDPPFVATPEPTTAPIVIYIVPSPTTVRIFPTPSPMPTVIASPTPLPASPTPSVQPAVTPTATPSMTPLPSITPSVTTKPALLPTHGP